MNSSDLKGAKVLVTGATGFIGQRLAEVLATQEKAMVMGAGRNLLKAENLKAFGIELISLDLTDANEMNKALSGVSYVFHCAGALGGDAEDAKRINEDATEQVIKSSAKAGVKRVVHVSTVGVYDMKDTDEVGEDTPLALNRPSNYPRTKARGEQKAFELGQKNGVDVVSIRPSMVYGPGDGVWTTMMYQNVSKGNPVFLGDGSYNFNPVYLDDVVDAMIKAATSPAVAGEAFNVSSGITTWKNFMSYYGELASKEPKGIPLFMAKLMAVANKIPGVKTPIDKGFVEMATSKKVFPVGKAKKLLNWEPQTSLEEGMEKTISWLRENSN